MRFYKQSEIVDDRDGRGSVWRKQGLDIGYGHFNVHPLAHEDKDFDIWDLGEGRDDRYCLQSSPWAGSAWCFGTLDTAIKFGELQGDFKKLFEQMKKEQK